MSTSSIALPEFLKDLEIKDFDMIWTYLNLDTQFNWKWLAGEIGWTLNDVKMIQGKSGNHAERFLEEWSEKGGTTKQLLSLLTGKRVDITQELAKTYVIPEDVSW